MSFSPHKFREIVFQLLFSMDMGNSLEEDLIPFFMQELMVTKKIVCEAYRQAITIWHQRGKLDQKIGEISQGYAFERIGRVEQNVLRLGVYELLVGALEAEIAIAEAVRLARKFGTPESANFVNAIMDAVYKEKDSASLPA